MPATPQISFPFPPPTQVASGQALAAGPVQQDLLHVASQFNTHTHDSTDFPNPGAAFLPIGGIIHWPGPTSFQANLWYCDGATYWVASFTALATACGTYWGGNASIGRIPDMQGRSIYGFASGGVSDVATIGNTDGVARALRTPKHRHTMPTQTQDTSVANNTGYMPEGYSLGGSPVGAYTGGDANNLHTGAFAVMPYLIRAL